MLGGQPTHEHVGHDPSRPLFLPQFHLDSTVTYFENRYEGNCTTGITERAATLRQARSECQCWACS